MEHYPLVVPKFEREKDAVEGPFYVVKGQCIACELPCDTAPQNITFNKPEAGDSNLHCRVVKQPETQKELDMMIEAAEGSCIEAIRYCGSDQYTIDRFKKSGNIHLCDVNEATERVEDKPWWRFW